MGPSDRKRQLLEGVTCTICDTLVPATAVRVLAEREDLLFVEFRCRECGSVGLGMLTDGSAEPAGGPAVGVADVVEMQRFLAGYEGDLRSLVARSGDPSRGDPPR